MCDSGYTAQTEKPLVFQRLTTELIRLWQTTGHILELPASGVSMLPLIRTGDRLTVHCTSLKALRNGDIIVYTDGIQTIVHRLIDRQRIETGWLACQKGDNLKGWTWVPETQVIGRVLGLVKADNNEWSTTTGLWRLINPCIALPATIGVRLLESALPNRWIIQRSRGLLMTVIWIVQQSLLRMMMIMRK